MANPGSYAATLLAKPIRAMGFGFSGSCSAAAPSVPAGTAHTTDKESSVNNTHSNVDAGLLRQVSQQLSTRTLAVMAEELRRDGESLREAVDRYEVDFAWHILGSTRLLDDTVDELTGRLRRDLTPDQRAELAALLTAAALGQASDQLMSFDNDLAQGVADVMIAAWGTLPAQATVAA